MPMTFVWPKNRGWVGSFVTSRTHAMIPRQVRRTAPAGPAQLVAVPTLCQQPPLAALGRIVEVQLARASRRDALLGESERSAGITLGERVLLGEAGIPQILEDRDQGQGEDRGGDPARNDEVRPARAR